MASWKDTMIHNDIIDTLVAALQEAMIDNIAQGDVARAGIVQAGPLQGDPDPETARISVTVHENDPDAIYKPGTFAMSGEWGDEVAELECGGTVIWKRRFSVKARCLLSLTQESATEAREIASTVRSRIEACILGTSFRDILTDNGEFVSKGVISSEIKGETVQAGGPPDAFDFHVKIRFQVETTIGVQL